MAWRIAEHVVSGEIDNRVRGRLTGRVFLAGVAEPLTLDLVGDCHPDLAGCRLQFENPHPVPMTTRPPASLQRGAAGDVTAARKVRTFDLPAEAAYDALKRGERPPERMANALYLEWLSPVSGRVLIEAADYRLDVSEPVWRFTPGELAERERLAAEGSTAFAIAIDAESDAETWDEFRHEQALRESDALGERYLRLLQKYSDHPDAERLIAREMGWTRLEEMLDRLAEEGEAGPVGDGEDQAEWPEFAEPDATEVDDPAQNEARRELARSLQRGANEALYALIDELRTAGHSAGDRDAATEEFVSQFAILNAKLAGALGGFVRGDEGLENGLVIAWLKRALEIHNGALRAADAMEGTWVLGPERLAHYRTVLFGVREEMLALIARLRE